MFTWKFERKIPVSSQLDCEADFHISINKINEVTRFASFTSNYNSISNDMRVFPYHSLVM